MSPRFSQEIKRLLYRTQVNLENAKSTQLGYNKKRVNFMIKTAMILYMSSLLFLFTACNLSDNDQMQSTSSISSEQYAALRQLMVDEQIAKRGINDMGVLQAMKKVPRHMFVPEPLWPVAYSDRPLPIGEGQTISQPYIVAYMTQVLQLGRNMKVLEVGTGTGYQAAVLAELVKEVYTIEIICSLAEQAELNLEKQEYKNIKVKCGDGYQGWPEAAPFDCIIVTAAPDHIPALLIEQLAMGGRMILPLGKLFQELVLITKTQEGIKRENLLPVRFVPMTGEAQKLPH
jgi:protein-L-isoaspartate(D-aspartate) O-methyltransferase